jgi:hypothetical protein
MSQALLENIAVAMRKTVEDRPRDQLSAEDAEHGLIVALKGMDVLRFVWAKVQQKMRQGMAAGDARREAASADLTLRAWESFLVLVCDVGEAVARREGISIEGLEEAPAAKAEIRRMLEEVGSILELLSTPRKPLDQDMVKEARAAFERGEGENLEDVLARRQASRRP